MTVYVDRAVPMPGRPRTCRMIADTNAELESMVESIGIRKRRILHKLPLPYITLCKLERERAIELGAKEVTVTSMSTVLRKFNATSHPVGSRHPAPASSR